VQRKFFKSTIITLICGLIFNLIVPIILLLVFGTLFSALTVLDPLYAGGRIEHIWTVFVVILAIQFVFASAAALLTNLANGFLTRKIVSGRIYVLGMFTGLFVHGVLLLICLAALSVAAGTDVAVMWGFLTFLPAGFFSLLIGLVAVRFNRPVPSVNP
jgi:hypothetical protein